MKWHTHTHITTKAQLLTHAVYCRCAFINGNGIRAHFSFHGNNYGDTADEINSSNDVFIKSSFVGVGLDVWPQRQR